MSDSVIFLPPREYVDWIYKQIKFYQDKLEKVRKECKHEETYEGYYSWGIGCMSAAKLCKNCDQFIEYLPVKDEDIGQWEVGNVTPIINSNHGS